MSAVILGILVLIALAFWAQIDASRARKLTYLRRNAWLRNERGHLVRYENASPAVRDGAER